MGAHVIELPAVLVCLGLKGLPGPGTFVLKLGMSWANWDKLVNRINVG